MDIDQITSAQTYTPPSNYKIPTGNVRKARGMSGNIMAGYVLEVNSISIRVHNLVDNTIIWCLPFDMNDISVPGLGELVDIVSYIETYTSDYSADPITMNSFKTRKNNYRYKTSIDVYQNSILNQVADPITGDSPETSDIDDSLSILPFLKEGERMILGRTGNGILLSYDNNKNPITHIFNKVYEGNDDLFIADITQGIYLENEKITIGDKEVDLISEETNIKSPKITFNEGTESGVLGDVLLDLLGEIIDMIDTLDIAAVPIITNVGPVVIGSPMTGPASKIKIATIKAKYLQTKKILSKEFKLK